MGNSYKQLSLAERALLQTQLVLRWSPAAIAAGLQRARSTITREMARNGWLPEPQIALRGRPRVAGGYCAEAAQERAARLAVKPRVVRKLVAGSALFGLVVAHLRCGLSPEQIASTLNRMDQPVRLSHETIYTALYAMPRGQLRARILTLLRRAHQHRRKRSAGKDRSEDRRVVFRSVLLSHETIYTALYAMPRGQLRARILTLLRRAHQHRRKRSAGKD